MVHQYKSTTATILKLESSMKTDLLRLFFQVCWDFQIFNGFQHSAFEKALLLERRIVFGKALFKMENISVAPEMSPTPLLRPRRKKGAKMNGNLVFFFMMRTQWESSPGLKVVIWLMCKCLLCLASLLFTNKNFITGVSRYLQALVNS